MGTPTPIMRRALTCSVSFGVIFLTSALPALSGNDHDLCQDEKSGCKPEIRGLIVDDPSTRVTDVLSNTEYAPAVDESKGYSVSVDGEVLVGSATLEDKQRTSDVALESADIQIKFDGLGVKPELNVSTVPAATSYTQGQTLEFQVALNYGLWVTRGDIRIFQHVGGAQMIAQIPVDGSGQATWTIPEGVEGKLTYVLRVYDRDGRYDETEPQTLSPDAFEGGLRDDESPVPLPNSSSQMVITGDRTALRNIPVYGGAVTVFGRDIDPKSTMYAFGEVVPVDADGNFVLQRILPPGDHTVQVELQDEGNNTLDFSRNINIPENDWFYVGLADLTLGKRFGKQDVEDAYPGEYKGIYNKGRLAFYLKGKIKGRTILTAALDTTEDNFKNLLTKLDEKDPRQFLKRIDPDDYYPVYGDDSIATEDAPTSGRFYVRVDRDDSHVMWGNFKAHIGGNKFLQNQRALYGAQGVYLSPSTSPDGGRRTEVSVHAAQPGTLTEQDNLRGTGGSAYFTKFQDVNKGSETVSVEVRDPITGFVISKTILKPGADYDFDYSQGVVLLNQPLATNVGTKPQFLVINYEYTPATADVKGYVFGGRGQQWLGNHLRVGVTGMRDNSGKANLDLVGADIRLAAGELNYIDFHAAQSRGGGFGNSTSHDGGLTFSQSGASGTVLGKALAYGVDAKSDLGDLTNGVVKGNLEFEYAHKGAGFSTLDSEVLKTRDDFRAAAQVRISEATTYKSSLAVSKVKGAAAEREIQLGVSHDLSERHTIEVFGKNSAKPGSLTSVEHGTRTDFGAKFTRHINEKEKVYAFGQGTAQKSGSRKRDDRAGVGGSKQISEQMSIDGEASYGTYGIGGLAKLNYAPAANSTYYLGYALDAYRELDTSSSLLATGTDMGAFIFGMRHRFNDQLATFVEDSYDLFGLRKTLAQTYGVEYTPLPEWTISGALEMGHVYDDTINATTLLKNSDFDRKALSLTTSYKNEGGDTARVKGEVRHEDSEDNKRDMKSYLLQVQSTTRSYDDWRLLLNADMVLSDSSETARDGKYIESSIGFAYRPTEDDKLNALFKYTYLYDLPGADQVTVNGTLNGPQQVSHILSADGIYDVTDALSIGAKYGVRLGKTRARSGGGGWSSSTAHLGILRADLNIHRQWDALLEGRLLWSPTAKSAKFGLVSAIYRHIGENFKAGLGYNFGQFSDDLRDLEMDDHGVFMNMVGQF